MDNYVAIVLHSDTHAYNVLHGLWKLDAEGSITVHGAAVIRRDHFGRIDVATKETTPGPRTAAGVGIGALLGLLAGPIGAAAGATVATATAAGIGAAAGGVAGLASDLEKVSEHQEAVYEAAFKIGTDQYAVIAEVSEFGTVTIDELAKVNGGTVYRRPKSAVRDESIGSWNYARYLYPYDYVPVFE